jgi:predicted transglutaminase-like cysteine proteinase
MITVSLQPLSPKKAFALIVALIGLFASVSCFANPVFLSVDSTPYDRQMSRIQPVLFTKAAQKENVTLALVNHWIQDLRSIPYGFSTEWKTPAEVESGAFADCKGKAVALYQKMCSCGAQNVRLVIGRRTPTSRKTHAWLEWTTESGNYVLDPTINWSAYALADVGNRSYIPLYAYAGARKYRAATGALVAKN